jgi:hypothetical protein
MKAIWVIFELRHSLFARNDKKWIYLQTTGAPSDQPGYFSAKPFLKYSR